MRIKYTYSAGYGHHADEIEIPDDSSDEEIEAAVSEAVHERLDWSWKRDQ